MRHDSLYVSYVSCNYAKNYWGKDKAMVSSTQDTSMDARKSLNQLVRRLNAQSSSSEVKPEQSTNSLSKQATPSKSEGLISQQAAQASLNASDVVNAVNAAFAQAQNNAVNSVNTDNAVDAVNADAVDPNSILQACYQRNMAALFKYEPNLYKVFCRYKPSEPLEIIYTKAGVPNVYFPNRKEFFYKTDDPIEMCAQQVEETLKEVPFTQAKFIKEDDFLGQIYYRYKNAIVDYHKECFGDNPECFPTTSCPSAIILGVGLGYHIGKIYERLEIANLVIVEPNADLFYASLYTFDWSGLLEFVAQERRGLCFVIGQTPENVYTDISEFYIRHGNMLAGLTWFYMHYSSKELDAVKAKLDVDFRQLYTTLGFIDDDFFGISHACYLTTHHARFIRNDVPLSEEIASIPLCVVANGASLSKDLPFLRKVQDKVLILACGTAIETLYNAGIQPFFYAAIERLKVVSESLSLIPDQDFIQNTVLISSDACHPETFNMFKHTALVYKANEAFLTMSGLKYTDRCRNIQIASLINPLVGNLGVAAGGFLQFKNIYLFGVDNGTKSVEQVHPQESVFYEKIKALNLEGHKTLPFFALVTKLPGNFGGEVYSSRLYKEALEYMEKVIKSNNDSKYHNCSDGAKIENAEPTHSADLLDSWLQRPDVDFQSVLEFIETKKTTEFNFSNEEIEQIVAHKDFDDFVGMLRKHIVERQVPKNRLDYVFMLEEVCELLYSYRNPTYCFAVRILNSTVNRFFIMILRVLYLTQEESLAIERAERQMGWFIDFLDDARELYKHVPAYYAEDHHKFFAPGKVGFDHPDSPAPALIKRKPMVTKEDQTRYPLRKFVKRYD